MSYFMMPRLMLLQRLQNSYYCASNSPRSQRRDSTSIVD